MYGNGGITVHLEMGVDSKHRNVGFLALSGRWSLVAFESACSQTQTWEIHWHHQPLRDFVRQGVSFGEAGLAQAIQQHRHMFGLLEQLVFASEKAVDEVGRGTHQFGAVRFE